MTMKDKNPDFLFNTLNLYYLIHVYTMKKNQNNQNMKPVGNLPSSREQINIHAGRAE